MIELLHFGTSKKQTLKACPYDKSCFKIEQFKRKSCQRDNLPYAGAATVSDPDCIDLKLSGEESPALPVALIVHLDANGDYSNADAQLPFPVLYIGVQYPPPLVDPCWRTFGPPYNFATRSRHPPARGDGDAPSQAKPSGRPIDSSRVAL